MSYFNFFFFKLKYSFNFNVDCRIGNVFSYACFKVLTRERVNTNSSKDFCTSLLGLSKL